MSEADATKPVGDAKAADVVETPQAVEQTTESAAENAVIAEETVAAETETNKTTSHGTRRNNSNNKFDPSTREVTDDPAVIRKQVEFYFGDWNFPQDKFMWETCEGTANKPMPLAKIHSFKRMRVFQPYSAVVAALRDSQFLDISGEAGEEVVKRKIPYKPVGENKAKIEAATVYVKGFGDENPNTQFDLESFFAKFGEIRGLKLRRTNEGLFKGSVFVTFPDEDEANKFIALDPAPTYKSHELKIMSKRSYCEEKSELIRQGKLEPNSSAPRKFFEGRDPSNKRNFRERDNRGARDGDDWKKRRENDQKHGFQEHRGNGRGRSRGGRGRGGRDRGGRGRGGFRGGRDGNDRDRGDGSQQRQDDFKDAKPRIQSTTEGSKDEAATNGKRAREEDAGEKGPAHKKVDTKEAAKSETS
ncbi:RNA-binding La domain protein [Drechmeria coniospora]|uniref:RNA-binding La domain protein n=1 Tax=Drechmeria coniospora TaxID=98403 RepID=A0A151GRK1_DRECN|nr:RNA-binding La domain protein [Drechmeria coniospora]KYK59632.1 RNA-binding La domain protein [Drechmeria coniospora]